MMRRTTLTGVSAALCVSLMMLGITPAFAQTFTVTGTAADTIGDATLCASHGGTGGTIANRTKNISVSGGPTSISNMDFGFLASHGWRGDIRLDLTSPGPSPVTVRLITTDTNNTGDDDDYAQVTYYALNNEHN